MFRRAVYCTLLLLPCSLVPDDYDTLSTQFSSAQKELVLDDQQGRIKTVSDTSDPTQDITDESACRRCIVQESDKITNQAVDGKALLETCKGGAALCDNTTINTLRESEDLAAASDTDFVNTLYHRSKITKSVALLPHEISHGRFTDNGLKQFLARAYKSGKLLEAAFSNPDELQVTDLALEWKLLTRGGGMSTKQLFSVKNTRTGQEFIVKEMAKKKKEAFDLAAASRYKPLQGYLYPNYTQGYPILVLPIACLEYRARGHSAHYVTVMHKAPGVEFLSIIMDYLNNPSDTNKTRLQNAYVVLAVTLANFHKRFMRNKKGQLDSSSLLGKTLVHGDPHAKNILFDEANSKLYWIDLERLGKSIFRPVTPAIDLGYVMLFPFFAFPWGYIFEMNIGNRNIDKQEWFLDFYEPFINAYLDAFGGDKVRHAQEMKALLSLKSEGDWVNKGRYLLRYINPIFENIVTQD